MCDNNNKNLHWAHGWHNINWELYASVRVAKTHPNPLGVKVNEKHLAKYLRNRYNLDKE